MSIEKYIYYTCQLIKIYFFQMFQVPNTITTSGSHQGSGNLSSNSSSEKFTVESVLPSNDPQHQRASRQRPLTGESGASSSSATPSLKSVEQSSQDSVNSSDGEGSDPDQFRLKSCLRSTVAPSSVVKNSAAPAPQKQPPQSTAI